MTTADAPPMTVFHYHPVPRPGDREIEAAVAGPDLDVRMLAARLHQLDCRIGEVRDEATAAGILDDDAFRRPSPPA